MCGIITKRVAKLFRDFSKSEIVAVFRVSTDTGSSDTVSVFTNTSFWGGMSALFCAFHRGCRITLNSLRLTLEDR